jgi:hypothetical protein
MRIRFWWVQLASVHLALAQGSSRAEDAIHILASLSEQYGPSLMLLNCMALANIVGGSMRPQSAEGNLKEAIADFGGDNDPDTLVNMVVCSQYLGLMFLTSDRAWCGGVTAISCGRNIIISSNNINSYYSTHQQQQTTSPTTTIILNRAIN